MKPPAEFRAAERKKGLQPAVTKSRANSDQAEKTGVGSFGVLVVWVLLAVLATGAVFFGWGRRPLEWGSAHFALIARNYAQHGILNLKALPIQNNDPIGPEPDIYTHWPPLFDMLLSFAYRTFGDTELVTRMVMLASSFACGGLVGLIAAEVADRRAALYSMLAFWCMPVMFYFGEMSSVETPALLFALAGLWFFLVSVRCRSNWASAAGFFPWLQAWAARGKLCFFLLACLQSVHINATSTRCVWRLDMSQLPSSQ